MAIYLSMQRVRFSSPDGYEKFKLVFANVRHHLKKHPGFLHLTWWDHADDPTWYNEISMWTSMEALNSWHKDLYHKYAKKWAANGAIMEDIITNFQLVRTRLLRVCPCCGHLHDGSYDLYREQHELAKPCAECNFHFPVTPESATSFAVYQDMSAERAEELRHESPVLAGADAHQHKHN